MGECLNMIQSKGLFLLILLAIASFAGVGFHVWLTRRLAFVDLFESEGSDKKETVRLCLPMGLVAIVCMILPLIVLASSRSLQRCIEDPGVRKWVPSLWGLILPVHDWASTLLTDALMGIALYCCTGIVLWVLTRGK